MSVAEFSDALRSKALKDWFSRLSRDNVLKISTKELRKKEAGEEFNSFYITKDTIATVIRTLTNADADPDKVTEVFKKLSNTPYGRRRGKGKQISSPYVEGPALYFPRISFEGISGLVEAGFEDVIQDARKRNPNISISDYFQKGHVFGIFPKKLAETRKSLAKNTTLTDQARQLLVGYLDDLEKQLEAEDLATSNLKTDSYTLYSKYRKKPNSYLVELQLKTENEAAGRAQAPLATAIKKFFNPSKLKLDPSGNIKFTEGAAEQRLKSLMEANVEKLIGTKGSPSMLELIGMCISETISGKKSGKVKDYSIPYTEIIKAKGAKVDTRDTNSRIKKDLAKIRSLKASAKAVPAYTPVDLVNLSSLQNIINNQLSETIQKNMGSGGRKDILNYRTGRLANSAKVERMTQSRAGMISAFYTYMRNPYGTFSEGGAQGMPRSRDPKLLISKSIREIAATQVANRMRAVLS